LALAAFERVTRPSLVFKGSHRLYEQWQFGGKFTFTAFCQIQPRNGSESLTDTNERCVILTGSQTVIRRKLRDTANAMVKGLGVPLSKLILEAENFPCGENRKTRVKEI